jgi:hypothetical protein
LSGPDQYLGDGDRGHRKAQAASSMRREQRGEARTQLRMTFEDVDDRRRVDQEQGMFRQIVER